MQINRFILWGQKTVTAIMGHLSQSRCRLLKSVMIRFWIRYFKIDMTEAKEQDIAQYATFNEFFIRPLKAGVRPMDLENSTILSPADGFISQHGVIEGQTIIQAKGKSYSVETLLARGSACAERFEGGQFICAYLSPRDYHRVHMPLAGSLRDMTFVPGSLYSVRPRLVTEVDALFAKNERAVSLFETPHGLMAVVLVGAMIVGSIHTTWHGQVKVSPNITTTWDYHDNPVVLDKGAQMGHFQVGSSVVVLFDKDMMLAWDDSLRAGQPIKMGQTLAHLSSSDVN